jgi:antitoxin component HigA of HigAB toxin-antitoxin module
MDQKGLAPRDLVPLIGSRNRVYEIWRASGRSPSQWCAA